MTITHHQDDLDKKKDEQAATKTLTGWVSRSLSFMATAVGLHLYESHNLRQMPLGSMVLGVLCALQGVGAESGWLKRMVPHGGLC